MRGIVFRGEIQSYKLKKVERIQSDTFEIPFDKTLFVDGVGVPVDLLPAAWHFLDRWDMAVPLWRYGQTAADVGTAKEREATRKVIRDLRVLLHSYELLFVRRNEAGRAFMEAWERECGISAGDSPPLAPPLGGNVDKRLAFLRALYLVKPKLCVLPISWLDGIKDGDGGFIGAGRLRHRWSSNIKRPLVSVELEPGRFVKVHKGEEERARKEFEQTRAGPAREAKVKKGKLIKVELQPGRFVKMHEKDAIEQGLIKPKRKPAGGDKMRKPAGDKAKVSGDSPSPQPPPPGRGSEENFTAEEVERLPDDFTTIEGVGKATARALNVWNINTFEELRAARDLSFLSTTGRAAIERWKEQNKDG